MIEKKTTRHKLNHKKKKRKQDGRATAAHRRVSSITWLHK